MKLGIKKSKVKDLRLEADDFSLRLFKLKNKLRFRAMKVKTKGRSETWPWRSATIKE